MENKDILFLRNNKAFLKIKPIEKAAGINNSVLVKSVDGKMNLPTKCEAPLNQWMKNLFAGYFNPDQAPASKKAPVKPASAPKATAAPKSAAKKTEPKPRKEAKEPAAATDNKARIAELEKELKNPPKNPAVGLKMWKKVREDELKRLRA